MILQYPDRDVKPTYYPCVQLSTHSDISSITSSPAFVVLQLDVSFVCSSQTDIELNI